MERFGWGIVGTGRMAEAMVATLTEVPSARPVAVTSRSPERAASFAARHGLAVAATPATLAERPDVDVVYVASTHDRHVSDAAAALERGVPVLCEKPLAATVAQARRLVEVARRGRVFLMEAMWMLFQPAWDVLVELIDDGRVGAVRYVEADFGFPADPDPGRRWFDPAQAGGALLDIGVYPVTFARTLLGDPEEVAAVRVDADTGVDLQVGAVMRHVGGALSLIGCSFAADTAIQAVVAGPEGRLVVRAPFHHATSITHHRRSRLVESFDVGYVGSGYRFEVEEVHRCLRAGLVESSRHPLDASLAVLALLERIREVSGREG